MKDMNTGTQIQGKTIRRLVLGLLASLAVITGIVAAPLAGTANAGGALGGVTSDMR